MRKAVVMIVTTMKMRMLSWKGPKGIPAKGMRKNTLKFPENA